MNGLVLSGGKSSRMGEDKGSLIYPPFKVDQRERSFQLLKNVCETVFVSLGSHAELTLKSHFPVIVDSVEGSGPGVGILSANQKFPHRAWLILACDFPKLHENEIENLVKSRNPQKAATGFIHPDGIIEPLLTIWEPEAIRTLQENFAKKLYSLSKTLASLPFQKVRPLHVTSLMNINTQAEKLNFIIL